MRSLKTLLAAGYAALLATGTAGTALAADMTAPPAPPPMPMAPPPALDAGGGFYLRGDIGVGSHNDSGILNVPGGANYQVLASSHGSTAFIGIGAGYAFNSWLRADATLEYRKASKFKLTELDTRGTVATGDDGINVTSGKVSAIVGLANAYVDLGTWHRITPFIGAGIGFASITTSDVRDVGYAAFAGGTGRAADKSSTRLAWAVHAGLGYDLSTNLKAEVAYRYLNMGTVNTGTVVCTVPCTAYNARIKSLDSHDIKVGLRYVFADMAPAPSFMPGPLVRKY
ncbi:MAG TPA: outer membrane beta-barrel protein [Rhabdaerophilum sp.]|nr:outer membrane beta-barrel protein [Rhabdaerophilum sp.]